MLSSLWDTLAKYVIAFLFGGLTVFVLLQNGFQKDFLEGTKRVDTVLEVRTKVDTFRKDTGFQKPEPEQVIRRIPVYVDSSEFDTAQFLANLDTLKLLQDYFKERRYARTVTDSGLKIYVRAWVWQNRLDSLKVEYEFQKTTQIKTKTVTETKIPFTVTPAVTFWKNYLEPNVRANFGNHNVGVGYRVYEKQPTLHYGYSFYF